MGPLLAAFTAAALAELGDKTQLIVIALAIAYGRPGQIVAGLAAAVLASSLVAAAAGVLVHGMISLRAASLLIALSLVFAGVGGLIRPAEPKTFAKGGIPVLLIAFVAVLGAEMGDKSQFITFALAAQFDSLLLAGLGAAAGILAVTIPAAMMAGEFREKLPLRAIRTAGAVLFLLVGAIVAVNALRLV